MIKKFELDLSTFLRITGLVVDISLTHGLTRCGMPVVFTERVKSLLKKRIKIAKIVANITKLM